MAGIYLHIPFCKKACHYCNFHFSTKLDLKDDVIAAMQKEIFLRADYLQHKPISTIYFGGGTPSVLQESDISALLQSVYASHSVTDDVEITLEANPDDISTDTLRSWKKLGINRLSIGVQGFEDEMLQRWNRNHSAAESLLCLEQAMDLGFQNISADLIYGDPGLSHDAWRSAIDTLIALGIPHISSYALTVETGTALHHQIQHGKTAAPEDEKSQAQYLILQSVLQDAGYTQYEISNFAKPGFASGHNSNYWEGVWYSGIGPAAHSFNTTTRQWNVAHNVKYVEALKKDQLLFESETLTPAMRFNEMVMTGLRTSKGIDLDVIRQLGEFYSTYLLHQIEKYVDRGHIVVVEGRYIKLQPAQYFFADGIAADLFRV